MKIVARLLVTQYGLCIQFQTLEAKKSFLDDMETNGINIFTHEEGKHCYVKKYTEENHFGQFVSQENRIALVFGSEQMKFIFKERLGLTSDSFMDMGSGYESQMHFNHKRLSANEGSSITTIVDMDSVENEFPMRSCSKF